MSNDWRISIAALLVLIAACNRQVDEKKMREMVREEVQREVARQVEEYQKAWKKSPVAKIGKIAEEEKPVTAQPESALPRAPIYDGATRQKHRRDRDQRRFENMQERIKRLKKRLDEMVAQKKPQQSIVRLKKSIKRLKSRISELKARLADPSEYKSTPETIATTGSSEPQIKRLGDYTYGITKDSLKKILPFLKGSNSDVRVAPNRNGGFRTFLVKPQSIFYKLGIRSGDIIQKFNNIPLNSAQETLDAFTKSKDVTNHTLTLSRRGRSLTILYKIE